MNKKIAIYLRVSTDKQRDKGHSIKAQKTRSLERIAHDYPNIPTTSIIEYDDAGYSSKDLNRPALKKLIQAISDGEIERIYFYSLDRISRSLMDLQYFLSHTEMHEVGLTCLTQELNFTSPEERMFVLLQGVFAQFEREKISERTKNGLIGGFEKGYYVFSTAPYGYHLQNKKLHVLAHKSEYVKRTYHLYVRKKMSINQILQHFRYDPHAPSCILSHKKLRHILENTAYIGYIEYHNKKYYCSPQIISDSLFFQAQELLKNGAFSRSKQSKHTYLYRSKLRCATCGRMLVGQSTVKKSRTYLYYICNNKSCSCYRKRILQEKLTEILLPQLIELSKLFFEKSKQSIAKNRKIDVVQKEIDSNIKKLTLQLEKAQRLLLDETLSKAEYRTLKKKVQLEITYYKNEKKLQLDPIATSEEFSSLTAEQMELFIKEQLPEKQLCLTEKIFVN